MKPTALLLLCFVLTANFCKGQNLVPNPSFEDILECPDFPGQVWRASGWYVAENTPDYFNCCCNLTNPVCGVPQNDFTFRYAASGVAYCGFFTYLNYPPTDFQEKIGIQLLTPLEIGVRYYVSMKLSSVNSRQQVSNGGHNKLGALFSVNKYDMNNRPPNNNYSHFYTASIITDTLGWVEIKGDFIADSSYNFVTIGNFYDNNHIDTIRYWYINENNGLLSYYFIDDVCVTTDSTGCDFGSISHGDCSYSYLNTVQTEDIALYAFPNPFNEGFTVELNGTIASSIEVFNVVGRCVKTISNLSDYKKIIVDLREFPDGIYLLRIQGTSIPHSIKIIKAHY